MYTIKFSFEQDGVESITLYNVEDGYTLLETALKNDIALHHNCGGVASCTTCHLYVEKGMEYIDIKERREADRLNSVIGKRLNSRLGCQSLLLKGDGEIEVLLPDQSKIEDEYYE